MTEQSRRSPRDIALEHAIKAKRLIGQARGDETSPLMAAGREALATARDEARMFGLDPTKLEADAVLAIKILDKPGIPRVVRDEYGFPVEPKKEPGW